MLRSSREEMWRALGLLDERRSVGVASATLRAYEKHASDMWATSREEAPHGSMWHTSFHASRFPGDDPMTCDRQALYEMMAVPDASPTKPFLVAIADAGKDIEVQIVSRWHYAGILLTEPPTAKHQTGFADPHTWLTCSLDAALDLRPEWSAVHPVDVKGKDHNVVESMIAGNRGPDDRHVRQLMVQIYFCRQRHEEMGWSSMGLEIAKGGSLLYVSRARPMTMQEFYIEYDEDVMSQGLQRLLRRRTLFVRERLPERDPAWEWTESPCRWCEFRTDCKKDVRKDVINLRDSAAAARAVKVNPQWSYDRVRRAVFDRWQLAGSSPAPKDGQA